MRIQNPLQQMLNLGPKKVAGVLITIASFAAIGVVSTASFVVNKTADLIAWVTGDNREESWMPLLAATFILLSLFSVLIKLFHNKARGSENINLTPEQSQNMFATLTNKKPTHSANNPAPSENPFPSGSDFAKNLRRAGTTLFAQSGSPASPSLRASTRTPSPVNPYDAILNETLEEVTRSVTVKKNMP